MKKALFLVLLLPMFLGGCETMKGLGKDIQGLGESIEESAGGES